jgi:hypothetical protein
MFFGVLKHLKGYSDYSFILINRDLFLSCALFVPLCVFLFSRLFWVSSLAYPNLLGTKGYVVVVVVVMQRRVLHCCCGCWKPETIKLIGTHWFLIIIGF